MKSILSYKVRPYNREELIMQKTMTYDQWKILYKKELRRVIKQKIFFTLQLLLAAALFLMPFWMIVDWLARGY